MTGNVALDAVIGLVFVYLLYSLYATILMELTSSLFGLRAKNLRYTLKRMLAEERIHPRGWNWLAKIGTTILRIGGYAPNMKNKELYQTFMNQPTIKTLGSGGFDGRPSYISAENFSKALIDSIKADEPELSLMAAIDIGLYRTINDNDVESTGNPKQLADDINNKPKVNAETRKHIESLMKDANYDPIKFKILLENWFNDTMERSTGWFKQTTQIVLLFIGFILVINFNVDSIAIIKKLSTDKDARDQMVKLATEYTEKNPTLPDSGSKAGNDSVEQRTADSVRAEELKEVKQSLENEIANSQSVLGSSWNLPDSVVYHTVKMDSVQKDSVMFPVGNSGGFIMLHKTVDAERINRQFRKIDFSNVKDGDKMKIKQFSYKLGAVFFGGHFWGYLLTVLALSLGAPFWFDLLNKLVKLRTGKQVADDSNAAAANKQINKDTLKRVG